MMPSWLKTWLVVLSAFALAFVCIFTDYNQKFPLWVIASGMHVADTLFHEMGHSIFGWLFGYPNIPSILTVFGADQAAGLTLSFGRVMAIQIFALAALAYACWQFFEAGSKLFWPLIIFSLFICGMAFSGYEEIIINYMGHGASIIIGGFFLYRGWLNLDSRNTYERWLNAFLGFTLTLMNMEFSYKLIHDYDFNAEYTDHIIGGITHNDFVKVADTLGFGNVHEVAYFTIGLAALSIISASIFAIYKYFSEEY